MDASTLKLVVLVGLGGALAIAMLALMAWSRVRIKKALQPQITKRRGRYTRGGLFRGPGFVFKYRGRDVWIFSTPGNRSTPPHFNAHTKLRVDRHARMEISIEHTLSRFGRWLGAQDIEVRDPAFDRAFMIKSDNENQVRRWLHSDLQMQLLAYKKNLSMLRVHKARLRFMVTDRLESSDHWDPFVETTLALIDAVEGRRAARRAPSMGSDPV